MKITDIRFGICVPLKTPFKTALRSVAGREDVSGDGAYRQQPRRLRQRRPPRVITGDTHGSIVGGGAPVHRAADPRPEIANLNRITT